MDWTINDATTGNEVDWVFLYDQHAENPDSSVEATSVSVPSVTTSGGQGDSSNCAALGINLTANTSETKSAVVNIDLKDSNNNVKRSYRPAMVIN